MILNALFTALAFLVMAAMAVIGLAVLLLPVYFWVLARDRAAEADMAEARRILGTDFPA